MPSDAHSVLKARLAEILTLAESGDGDAASAILDDLVLRNQDALHDKWFTHTIGQLRATVASLAGRFEEAVQQYRHLQDGLIPGAELEYIANQHAIARALSALSRGGEALMELDRVLRWAASPTINDTFRVIDTLEMYVSIADKIDAEVPVEFRALIGDACTKEAVPVSTAEFQHEDLKSLIHLVHARSRQER